VGGDMPDLSARVGSVRLRNPVMTAAGTSGHGAELGDYFELSALGAIVVKSLSVEPWPGNRSPRLCPVPGGMLNSVGLQGPGIAAWAERDLPQLVRCGAQVVVSIWGRRVEDYAAAGALLASVLPTRQAVPATRTAPGGVIAVEVNVSCPNLEDRSRMFAHSPAATAAAVRAASSSGLPVWAKLSPNTDALVDVAGAAFDAGAEAVTLVNTLTGLAIDIDERRPVLCAGGGGLSGAALHSVALRAVYDCRAAYPDAAIVGVGGIADGAGAFRMLLAGADAVQIGTATLAEPGAPRRVLEELAILLEQEHVSSVAEIVGAAQQGDARPAENRTSSLAVADRASSAGGAIRSDPAHMVGG
jgi:dihydroorotate dehydrogenase (NAD+) catalytic subunit